MPGTIDLIEAEIPRLRRYARSLVRDPQLADDLVQDCLERALRAIDSWQPGTNLRAWLFTILRNCHISSFRNRRREVAVIDGGAEPPGLAVSGGQEESLALTEVGRAYRQLSEEHREILMLVAIEGLAYEEAATTLGVAVGTVRSRLSRARAALRVQLEGSNVVTDASQARPLELKHD
jgi:RNA polymerase sigma-70 factor (ECF subfamily)